MVTKVIKVIKAQRTREIKAIKAIKARRGQAIKGIKELPQPQGLKATKEQRALGELKAIRGIRATKAIKGIKELPQPQELKATKESKGSKGSKEQQQPPRYSLTLIEWEAGRRVLIQMVHLRIQRVKHLMEMQ
tara:strand:+ start:886 stop:1284 length:399 start_codon:yes stop_codon:yes gene_type:complete